MNVFSNKQKMKQFKKIKDIYTKESQSLDEKLNINLD